MKSGREPLDRAVSDASDPGRRNFCLDACWGLVWLGMAAPVQRVLSTEMPSESLAGSEPDWAATASDLSDPGWTY
jgi:hypothetical protein